MNAPSKTRPTGITKAIVGGLVAVLGLAMSFEGGAQETRSNSPDTQERMEASQERFKALFKNAQLSGRWAPLDDGVLGEERGGDTYNVVSVSHGEGDRWTVHAKMKLGERELVVPIPVRVQFAGDTAILMVDRLTVPGGGTYSARLLIHERTYSGVWSGARGGGMLYGVITNQPSKE